jgi:leucyl/phenylalanyl-tRNA--protein transferase
MVLYTSELRVSRSLAKRVRSGMFEVRIDSAFDDVILACADPRRPHGWINKAIREAYRDLHRRGWAHSVETWADGELVGGLYGIAIGGLFAGESMFHRATDASKVAVLRTVEHLTEGGAQLFDVQWLTPHLESLGAIEIPRRDYVRQVAAALAVPGPAWPSLSS